MAPANRPILGMVLKGYPRISETFISNEIKLLEDIGFPIHIFSMRQPRESFSHKSVKQIQAAVSYLPETLLLPLPRFLHHNLLLAKKIPRRYRMVATAALKRLKQTRKMATLKHFFQAGYLVHRFLPRCPVVHLHAHFAHSPASVTMYASQLSGIPFSFTAHAKDIYTSEPERLAEKIGFSRFVITCTEYNKKFLMKLAPANASSIHGVYHGIDTDLFSNQSEKIRPAPPYEILTIARLIKKKGIPTVLRSMRILRDQGVPFRHVLIGDGDEKDRILSLIKELALQEVTQWLGTQPHDVVLDHYRKADLFVLGCEVTPNGDRDGIPNVVFESMAMGVPVVITHESAIPEVVRDGETGLLVPPRRPADMAHAMRRLLTDTQLRQTIIPAARNCVINEFDNKRLIRELAAVYRENIPEFREVVKSSNGRIDKSLNGQPVKSLII